MAFIEPMHRNKPNITYLLTLHFQKEKPNLGLMKIVKQLQRKEIKLID